ncbi:hypothetical protein HK102_004268 [Quaeritorhiza haematococci]|nr:hypothetical protein HK102_004268 [Quaeritorhiza haematococci]
MFGGASTPAFTTGLQVTPSINTTPPPAPPSEPSTASPATPTDGGDTITIDVSPSTSKPMGGGNPPDSPVIFVCEDEKKMVAPATDDPSDPLLLSGKRVNSDDLKKYRKRKKALAKFYERQNELIDELLKPIDWRNPAEEKKQIQLKIALYGTFATNIVLFGLQLTAALSSGSLALFATMADAFMDLTSNTVLLLSQRAANKSAPHKYPTGKARMETAGIIVFSVLMTALSIQLVIEGVKKVLSGVVDIDLRPISIACIGVAIATKICFFIYCSSLRRYPTARILAQDHGNDIVLNTFGVALSIIGAKLLWWVDPAGAILIALLILRSWTSTAYEQIQLIVGKSAEPSFLQKVTYIALTHDSRIHQVDTCRAYHSGNNYFVEVDIVLPPEMPLKEAHDVGEALQIKLETLEDVERAFVHLDYESLHKPEH